jgi:hypothetical protein
MVLAGAESVAGYFGSTEHQIAPLGTAIDIVILPLQAARDF